MSNIPDKTTSENGAESAIYDGIIIYPKRKKLFFDYLGIKLKLTKIILQMSLLIIIVATILLGGINVASVGGIIGSVLAFFGVGIILWTTLTPFIMAAALVFAVGTGVVAVKNSPKRSFKTAQNVIVEEITKYLFLPALVLIKQNASNFYKTENDLVKVLKKQMADIGYTEDYIRVFFERHENRTVKELENILPTLKISSDKLLKKKPGKGRLYSSDFKPATYVNKAIELCDEINHKYCDEVAKQNENKKTIIRLKELLSAGC